jgi:hypothetical protein
LYRIGPYRLIILPINGDFGSRVKIQRSGLATGAVARGEISPVATAYTCLAVQIAPYIYLT